MFSGGFVVTVLVDGQVCEESKQGIVQMPFGSEYVLRLRNRTDQDAVAQIFIDGDNVSEGGYIVRRQSFVDIERHVSEPSKFRFVSANSSEAQDAGKNDQPDDRNGVIEVKWRAEKVQPKTEYVYVKDWSAPAYPWKRTPDDFPPYKPTWTVSCGEREEKTSGGINLDSSRSIRPRGVSLAGFASQATNCCSPAPAPTIRSRKLEEGCTVEGSHSNQSFRVGHIGDLVSEEVIVRLVLKGFNQSKVIARGRFCGNCGGSMEARHKFCPNCGSRK